MMPDSFELGPIRPPSEAYSLLIRVTKNCSWNRCKFCHIYKGQRFELRPVAEVKQDILAAKAIQDGIKSMAWKSGYGGSLEAAAAAVPVTRPARPTPTSPCGSTTAAPASSSRTPTP
jgi:hypothetical protein